MYIAKQDLLLKVGKMETALPEMEMAFQTDPSAPRSRVETVKFRAKARQSGTAVGGLARVIVDNEYSAQAGARRACARIAAGGG